MGAANALNISQAGVIAFDGINAFTGSVLTQHDVLVGGTSNAITSVSPSTAGFVLTSNGVSADPSFQAVSASGAITTITGNSGGAESPSAGNFNFSGGTTGLTFAGTAATETLTGTLVIANGGTSVTSVTTSPTATAFAGWDANKNLSANSFIEGYRTTATAAATTTLVVGDAEQQYFTGSTTQTVVMPVTSTLVLGQKYTIVNNSSGVVTVQSSGTNTIQAMAANTVLTLVVINTAVTTAAGWNATYQSNAIPSGGITTLAGDSGSATGSTVNVIANQASRGSGQTVLFTGSSDTLTLSVTDASQNITLGQGAGKSGQSGSANTCIGYISGTLLTNGSSNTFVGYASGAMSTGAQNTGIGYQAGSNLISGTYNIYIGYNAGSGSNNAGSSNILMNSAGSGGDSHTLIIGAGTGTSNQQLSSAFISGINGVTTSNTKIVTINSSTDQLGVVTTVPIANGGTNAASFTQTNGIVTYNGTSLVNYAGPQLSSGGLMTNTTQPVFFASLSSTDSNVTGDGTTYTLGGGNVLSVTQQGSNMSTGGTFTAPVTGYYLFTCNMSVTGVVASTDVLLQLLAGGANINIWRGFIVQDSSGSSMNFSTVYPLSATQTAQFKLTVQGASKTVSVAGGAGEPTTVSGYLIC